MFCSVSAVYHCEVQPFGVLILILLDHKLVVSWLSSLSDVPLMVRSVEGASAPTQAYAKMWLCCLEFLAGTEAA